MKRRIFLKFIMVCLVAVVFVTIYQHNLLIKLTYQKRRTELEREAVSKLYEEKLKEFYQQRDLTLSKSIALHQYGMKSLQFNQVAMLPVVQELDFYAGSTGDVVVLWQREHELTVRGTCL